MAVFLERQSKRKLSELPLFFLTVYEFKFSLTGSIDILDWPRVFSEFILATVAENTPLNSQFGLSIDNANASGYIPFMPLTYLSPLIFEYHFQKIFSDVEQLLGSICLKATFVSMP